MSTSTIQHTLNHVDCPACETARLEVLKPVEFGCLRFKDAAPLWLRRRKDEDHIKPNTEKLYKKWISTCLGRFFNALPLERIHIGHVREYQKLRTGGGIGASAINHEVNCLAQIMGMAGLWPRKALQLGDSSMRIANDAHAAQALEFLRLYKPLKLPEPTVGKALEDAEEEKLFTVASSRKRWLVAYLCSIVSATTGAGPGEIRHLRIRALYFEQREIEIDEGTKRGGSRKRRVGINDQALTAINLLLKRYERICRHLGVTPSLDHYLLPGRRRNRPYDPTIPMGSWRKAWEALREKAGMPELRMYDLRHHVGTRLLENPNVSDQTAEEVMGWEPGSGMRRRYSHTRKQARQRAAQALSLKLPIPIIETPDTILPRRPAAASPSSPAAKKTS